MDIARSQSVPASTLKMKDGTPVSRSLLISLSQAPLSTHNFPQTLTCPLPQPLTRLLPHLPTRPIPLLTTRSHLTRHIRTEKKKNFCKVDRRELKKDVSIRKRSLLGPLFKSASVDGKSLGTLTISPTPHRLFPVCGTRENILSYGHISLKRRKCFPE